MSVRDILFRRAGGLRAFWRVVLFALVVFVAWLVLAVTLYPALRIALAYVRLGEGDLTSEAIAQLVALILATAVSLRLVDHERWSSVWLERSAARPRWLTLGFTLGGAAIALPILLLIALKWEVLRPGEAGSWIVASGRVSLFLLAAALNEELLVRGYIFAVLQRTWGWTAAIVITSIAFGALHLFNPGATVQSLTLVTAAGVFLSLLLWATRSLYAAWMAHFAWNWTMAVGFHTAVSGVPLEMPVYRYVDAGPSWATGGTWGPEGGLAAGAGLLAGVVAVLLTRRKTQTVPG